MVDEFQRLDQAIADERFPDVDIALRRGTHIDTEALDWYEYLVAAKTVLAIFYDRFGCELIQASAGYFYLLPRGERLGRQHLSAGEMLAGQALALIYLDPAAVQGGGIVPRSQVLELLVSLLGEAKLLYALTRRRRRDEKVDQSVLRGELDKAIRSLQTFGFVASVDDVNLRVRAPVLRFAEPARGVGDPAEALRRALARGEVVAVGGEAQDPDDGGE